MIMNKRITLFISFWLVVISMGFAQNSQQSQFTLNDCILLALENNNDLKSSKLQTKSAIINYKQSKNELLPNLNMNYNIGVNDGRSIDPFTNSYNNQELTFSTLGGNLSSAILMGSE